MKMPQILLLISAGICMIGQGSRMIVEGILKERYYRPNTFDMLFDWTTLAVIGIIMFVWGVFLFYKETSKRNSRRIKIRCPSCGNIYKESVDKERTECRKCHEVGIIDLEPPEAKEEKVIAIPVPS